MLDVVGLDDVRQRRGVECEENGTQNGPLWNPTSELDWVRGEAVDDDGLVSVRKVRKKPGVSRASDAKGVLEAVEEDGVINSVKGSREIEQGEERDVARVS